MTNDDASFPTAPPDKIKAWRQQLHRSNFVNTARQWEDLRSLGDVRSVLIVGPGQGLDTLIFRWRGYEVTTGHFWELGMRGFRVPDLLRRFETCFEVVRHYRNADWIESHNFVLRSRLTAVGR